MLAEEDAAKLELYLWSPAEQRLPYAARQKFFTERIKEFFGRHSLDVGLYFPVLGPGCLVHGSPTVISLLKAHLEASHVQR